MPRQDPRPKRLNQRLHPTPHFTVQQIENRLVAVLAPVLQAKGGSVHSFAEWTLAGHGIVLVLSTGQEFWLPLAEAYLPASTSTPR